jgi:molybdate transport system substrate-binding protein
MTGRRAGTSSVPTFGNERDRSHASTLRALPDLKVLRIPDALNARSAFGIGAAPYSAAGERFVAFVLGPASKAILHGHGFN